MNVGDQVRRQLEERQRSEQARQAEHEAKMHQLEEQAATRQAELDKARQQHQARIKEVAPKVTSLLRSTLADVANSVPEIRTARQRSIEGSTSGYSLSMAWGNKLGPTPEEQAILDRTVISRRIREVVRETRAPDQILVRDAKFIHAEVSYSTEDPSIPIGVRIGDSSIGTAEELLANPNLAVTAIARAIEQANTNYDVETKGEGYLRLNPPPPYHPPSMGGVDGGM